MRRTLIALVAASLIVGLTGGAAASAKRRAKRVEHKVTLAYDASSQVGVNTPVAAVGYVWTVELPATAGRKDKYVTIEFSDMSGQNVYATVSYSPEDPTGVFDLCGSTDEPQKVSPNTTLYVWIWQGTCPSGEPSLATSGTITATFSNLP
jgi:hypothetical protein